MIFLVIPTFERSLNLNNTETREGNKAIMICQCEAKPNPKMRFHRVGYAAPYVNGVQPVSFELLPYWHIRTCMCILHTRIIQVLHIIQALYKYNTCMNTSTWFSIYDVLYYYIVLSRKLISDNL